MTAAFIAPVTGTASDPADLMPVVEANVYGMGDLVNSLRTTAATVYADVDVRAEFRAWGSYPKTMAAMTGKAPERHAAPAGSMLCTGKMFRDEIRRGDAEVWNGAGHRGIVWASNDGAWIDGPERDHYFEESMMRGGRRIARRA